jgi:hypothetical protein
MLLARLVTGRYGYAAGEQHPHPATVAAAGQGWFARLLTAIFARKRRD